MEFLQRLAETVLAALQRKILDHVLLEKYENLFTTDLFGIQEITETYQRLIEEDSPEASGYRKLVRLCGGTQVGRRLLDYCLTALLYPEFQQLAGEYWNGITLDAVAQMCEPEPSYQELKRTGECAGRLLQCQKDSRLFLRNVYWADARILDYFLDPDAIEEKLVLAGTVLQSAAEDPGECYVNQGIEKHLEQILHQQNGYCMQIAGAKGCGKRFLLQKACHETGKRMLMTDMSRLKEQASRKGTEEISTYARLLIREGLLLDCGICLYHIRDDVLEQVLTYFLKPMLEQGLNVILCTEAEAEVIPRIEAYVECVQIPAYGRNERIALWEGFTKQHGIREQVDCVAAGSKFKLSAGEIRKAVERIAHSLAADMQQKAIETGEYGEAKACGGIGTAAKIRETQISQICEEVLLNPACGSIKRIHVQYTLEDLKLWPEQKRILNNICAHVWHRHKVYDDWNMDSRYAYGKNVSALFFGPPGTGKTMAVHVIANMLNLPLYRIDLSQVVDKYIGETEKRLEEIFDAAEKNNTVLFFDEADSIFGKRSEVNEAKDKYANTEVSYILQRIEQYDGIVILATNYRKNIDEAFMRRIRYVVEFSLPDVILRKELWQSSFSKEIPIREIDFDYLAEQFELSGGAIKNIVLNASFLAAAANRPVLMVDVLRSVRNENVKSGKVMLNKDFGLYAEMMEEADRIGSSPDA